MQTAIDIFTKAQTIDLEVRALNGIGINHATISVVVTNETLLERLASLTLMHESISDLFRMCGIAVKRLPVQKISAELNKIFRSLTVHEFQLVGLYGMTTKLFTQVQAFPSVKRICGDPDSVTDSDDKREEKEKFMNGLAYFVARQILLVKTKLCQTIDERVAASSERYLEAVDGRRSMYSGLHQIANKLRDGGLSPAEAKEKIGEVYTARRAELAEQVRKHTGGYLSDVTKPTIAIVPKHTPSAKQHDVIS